MVSIFYEIIKHSALIVILNDLFPKYCETNLKNLLHLKSTILKIFNNLKR